MSQAATKEADSIPVLNVSDTQSFYVCSLSSRTITYKGQLSPEQVKHEEADRVCCRYLAFLAFGRGQCRSERYLSRLWQTIRGFREHSTKELGTSKSRCSWVDMMLRALDTACSVSR